MHKTGLKLLGIGVLSMLAAAIPYTSASAQMPKVTDTIQGNIDSLKGQLEQMSPDDPNRAGVEKQLNDQQGALDYVTKGFQQFQETGQSPGMSEQGVGAPRGDQGGGSLGGPQEVQGLGDPRSDQGGGSLGGPQEVQ